AGGPAGGPVRQAVERPAFALSEALRSGWPLFYLYLAAFVDLDDIQAEAQKDNLPLDLDEMNEDLDSCGHSDCRTPARFYRLHRLQSSLFSDCPASSRAMKLLGSMATFVCVPLQPNLMYTFLTRFGVFQDDCEVIARLSPSQQPVVDVGANIGTCSTLLASQRHDVLAIEPSARVVPVLRASVALHQRLQRPAGNITVLQAALGAVDGVGCWVAHAEDDTQTVVLEENGSEDCAVVPLWKLDSLLRDFTWSTPHSQLGLLKIDVEGRELAVLEGARNVLAERLFAVVVFECCAKTAPETIDQMISFFDELGYDLFVWQDTKTALRAVSGHADLCSHVHCAERALPEACAHLAWRFACNNVVAKLRDCERCND
ncbi:unnamed protein product, partial [Effrenium voratum]